jgi:hypothetical protein
VSEGLSTLVLPAAIAGANFQTDRLAADRRGVVLHVLGAGTALEVAGRPGEEADLVDREHDLVVDEGGSRLSGVLGLEVGELVGPLLHRVGDAEQRELPLGRGGLSPFFESGGRGGVGGVHVGGAGYRRGRVGVLGRGVDDREGVVALRVDVLTVDEVAQRAISHAPTLLRAGSCRN